MGRSTSHHATHVTALITGLIAMVVLFTVSSGVMGYLIGIAVGLIALIIAHQAVKRPGSLRWVAIAGLVLSYLELVVSVGLLAVRLARVLGN